MPSLLLQSTIAMATAEHLLLDKTWFDDGRLFATEPFRPQPPAADEAGFPDTPPRFFRDYRRRDFDDDRHRYRSNPPSPYGYRTDPVDGFPAPLRRSAFHD